MENKSKWEYCFKVNKQGLVHYFSGLKLFQLQFLVMLKHYLFATSFAVGKYYKYLSNYISPIENLIR